MKPINRQSRTVELFWSFLSHLPTKLLVFVAIATTSTPSLADDLEGNTAPAFQEAIAIWLDGDDAASLPSLSELAIQGNKAARLFLARLEMIDRGHSDFRQSLGQTELRDLFRAPDNGSRFRKTWITIERENGNELAQVLSLSAQPTPNLAVVDALRSFGEIQATDHPTRIIGFNGTNEQRSNALESGLLLPELRPYVQFHMNPEPLGDGLMALRYIVGRELSDSEQADDDTTDMARLLSLGFGYQHIDQDNLWYDDVSRWLMSDQSMRPISNLCTQTCREDANHCAMTLMALTAGYYEVIRLDSPLENVVPQDQFLSSIRAQQWALRRAALTAYELTAKPFEIEDIRRQNVCVASLVENVRQTFP